MPNTPQEDQLAVTAFREISRRYADQFNMNSSVKGFCQSMITGTNVGIYVKFMDQQPFMTNFNIGGSQKLGSACAVCGFTAPKTGNKYDREMYINRQHANASTVIHEMLHFLTHPQFWMYMSPQITEAVTEYFTRKVIGKSKEASFDLSQRSGRYDLHHQYLGLGRADIKTRTTQGAVNPGKGYMKRAYFQGDQSAIAFIKKEFQTLEEMLGADPEEK